MQTNILWTGREYDSLENCLINNTAFGKEITSTIIGEYKQKIYLVEYSIRTNQNWETIFFEVFSRHSNHIQRICFESDGKGNWTHGGTPLTQFRGCTDIDISLTPFTNSLPINRLKLSEQQEQEIQVIYVNLLEQQIVPVRQRYLRLSETEYHYENVPKDFEAIIQVDKLGFVVDYPSLFVRKAALETNYL
jgi:hypothetical protein